ncbi:endo alpha-1,4 polygalactosaminidase [Flavobacterium columnare]|uniref:endo alpha-1,4 polygalactosaminidase n=1 Tax=Flavobacterium columnare TaxID=996 RepID=UPI002D20393C|nr:endo alpha-1,4 polygalactosaminidase [Flavobacterium columnare]MEB3800507.1 endo alpha-1,4 polygalactosaminidase [Flavobacterium columnare]
MKIKSLIIAAIPLLCSCNKESDQTNLKSEGPIDFKQKMREFVINISKYSKTINPNFYVIPQNGIELVSTTGDDLGAPHDPYLDAIDANGQEDLFYSSENDNQATPNNRTEYLKKLLNISKNSGNKILVIDFCSSNTDIFDSYSQNDTNNYTSFATTEVQLNSIPPLPNPINQENDENVVNINNVKNFLYIINPTHFRSKDDFIAAVNKTNYDLIITDLFFKGVPFTASEISRLKNKENGGKRLVISYMSIGEAESYRYYWQPNWIINKPNWLDEENSDWKGNFKVKYWDENWQSIIYGNNNSYLKKILDANFDGVYLDLIDAFDYYSN